MDDIFVRLGVALFVVDIPAEGLKERINKFAPKLGFIVGTGKIGLVVALKPLNEFKDFFGNRDLALLSLCLLIIISQLRITSILERIAPKKIAIASPSTEPALSAIEGLRVAKTRASGIALIEKREARKIEILRPAIGGAQNDGAKGFALTRDGSRFLKERRVLPFLGRHRVRPLRNETHREFGPYTAFLPSPHGKEKNEDVVE